MNYSHNEPIQYYSEIIMGKITYTIYPDLSLVHFHGTGDISLPMIMDSIGQLHTHPKWRMNFNTFVDFEHAAVNTDLDSFASYQNFFQKLQDSSPVRKWAIYTHRQKTHQAANMTHLLHSKTIIVDIFHIRSDALRFLGVKEEQLTEEVGTG
jgi:hypothetical protein